VFAVAYTHMYTFQSVFFENGVHLYQHLHLANTRSRLDIQIYPLSNIYVLGWKFSFLNNLILFNEVNQLFN